MKRVLCVSPHFPPDPTAGAHRMRLLAPHLPRAGWTPTVLTVAPASYEGYLDETLQDAALPPVEVMRVPALSPRRSRRLGFGDLGLRALPHLWAHASRLCRDRQFDAAFITTYPIYPALLGPWLRARYGVRYCIDLQDPWVGSWGQSVGPKQGKPDLRSRLARSAAMALERMALLPADAITAVSERTIAEAFARHGRRPPAACVELPIGWEPADWQDVPVAPRFFDEPGIHICYIGTLLPAGIVVADAFLRALRLVFDRSPELRTQLVLHFIGTSNEARADAPARLLPLAAAHGVADVCREHPGRVPFRIAAGLSRHAAALLILGSTEPHYNASKLYTSLAAQRPLFALMHRHSPTSVVLESSLAEGGGRLVTFVDEAELAASVPEIARGFADVLTQVRRGGLPNAAGILQAHAAAALAQRLGALLDRMVEAPAIAAVAGTRAL
jgi:hypothetical protein